MTIRWEYKIITFGTDVDVHEMNKLGRKGWNNYSNAFNQFGNISRMYWKRILTE